jgi:hypothetical protein
MILHHSSSFTHSSSQPGGSSPGHTSHALPGNIIYIARLSILILSKTYPSKRKSLPLIMQGFWLVGLFAKKLLSSESLLSHFGSCSSKSNYY